MSSTTTEEKAASSMPRLKSRYREEIVGKLREDFEFNDGDNDGRIQFAEFAELMALLEADMDQQDCRLGFREIDTDGDGAIEFDEFVAWWTTD